MLKKFVSTHYVFASLLTKHYNVFIQFSAEIIASFEVKVKFMILRRFYHFGAICDYYVTF